MRRSVFTAVIVFAIALGGTRPASATSIAFQATDLPDGGGGDLWQYDYFLSGAGLLATLNQGFVVYFDDTLYSDLVDLASAPADWSPLVLQPDTALHSSGTYDALALVDNSPFTGPFSVSFIWLGATGTIPGSQPFDIYELDSSGVPDAVERGVAAPVDGAEVPEPSTLLLLGTGVAAARRLRKRRDQSPR